MLDLHTHSLFSDGSLSPTLLMEEAAEKGINVIALTDHDTINGLKEAAQAASKLKLTFVPGVELQINFYPGEFHLLGLGLSQITSGFAAALSRINNLREERNDKILALINQNEILITKKELLELAGDGVIGRPHIAKLMAIKGLVKTPQKAFDKYLGFGRPYYIPKEGLDLEEAINHIHNCGGKAIVAHPLSLYVSWGRLKSLMEKWKEMGIDGIEAYHPGVNLKTAERLKTMGQEYGFLISGGSDYHGNKRADRKLGKSSDNIDLSEDIGKPFLHK